MADFSNKSIHSEDDSVTVKDLLGSLNNSGQQSSDDIIDVEATIIDTPASNESAPNISTTQHSEKNNDTDNPNESSENNSNIKTSESTNKATDATSASKNGSLNEAAKAELKTRDSKKKTRIRQSKVSIIAMIGIILLFIIAVIYLMNFLGLQHVSQVADRFNEMTFGGEWKMWL